MQTVIQRSLTSSPLSAELPTAVQPTFRFETKYYKRSLFSNIIPNFSSVVPNSFQHGPPIGSCVYTPPIDSNINLESQWTQGSVLGTSALDLIIAKDCC